GLLTVCAEAGPTPANAHHAMDSAAATVVARSRNGADGASLTVMVNWDVGAQKQLRGSIPDGVRETVQKRCGITVSAHRVVTS
ncbi:hypothetical protein SCB29_35970, partial [Paraburkholderia sp. SIMBA_055]